MKPISEMTTDEIRGEIFRLRDSENQEAIARVALLRKELNERLKDVPLPEIEEDVEEGSFALGFALAYFLTILGCIIALLIDKPATKKGAIWGLIFEFITGALVGLGFLVWFLLTLGNILH